MYSVSVPKVAPPSHEYSYGATPPVTEATSTAVEVPAQIVMSSSASATVGFSLLWSMVTDAVLVQPLTSVMVTV